MTKETNEEKAQEIRLDYTKGGYKETVYATDLEDALKEMAKWKEKQMIEKVCEWLKDNANDYLDWYDWESCRVNTDELLYDFRKAMKGE